MLPRRRRRRLLQLCVSVAALAALAEPACPCVSAARSASRGPQLQQTLNVYSRCALHVDTCRDQRLYVQQLPEGGAAPGAPAPLTAADSKLRFADGAVDAGRNRWDGGDGGCGAPQLHSRRQAGRAVPSKMPASPTGYNTSRGCCADIPPQSYFFCFLCFPAALLSCRLLCVVEDHSGDGEAATRIGAVGESKNGIVAMEEDIAGAL